jgi:hypothetical protein
LCIKSYSTMIGLLLKSASSFMDINR